MFESFKKIIENTFDETGRIINNYVDNRIEEYDKKIKIINHNFENLKNIKRL